MTIMTWIIVGLVVTVVIAGHTLLIRSAWNLRGAVAADNSPSSTPRADLLWSIVTAAATLAVLGWLVMDLIVAL